MCPDSLWRRITGLWRSPGRESKADAATGAAEDARPLPIDTPEGPVAVRFVGREGSRVLQAQVLLRDQVLRFSVPPHVGLNAQHAFGEKASEGVWSSFPERRAGRLLPCLRPWPHFVGAAELMVKAKAFDDGLVAAVEIASQESCGAFRGKRPLLRALLDSLSGGGPATSCIEAACGLGGLRSARSPEAARLVREFLSDELRSKPIGVYTWTEELGRIFRQDRMLQCDLAEADDAGHVAAVLARAPGLAAGYDQCLRLAERLTNPLACEDLRAWVTAIQQQAPPPRVESGRTAGPSLAIIPPSRSREADLAVRLYGNRPIPEDADLLRDLIREVRAGAIDLMPRPESGWYDWQTWALETLVAPERAEEAGRVWLEPSYREHLDRLFRAALALGRETHVKQLEVPTVGACLPPPVIVSPSLRLEPLVTLYRRRAEGYRFIRGVLDELFGEAALSGLCRLRRDGPGDMSLAEELGFMEALFEGAANVARLELGVSPKGETATFVGWMRSRGDDPDLTADLRMMVPVYHDVGRKRTKVWMFLGWFADSLEVAFEHPPQVRDLSGRPLTAEFEDVSYPIATPVIVEALVSRVLDRDEFRAACDRHATPEAIVHALE